MSRISYQEHKANARTVWGTPVFDFKINDSITKTHFKALMRVAKRYDSKTKTGHIVEADKSTFLEIVAKAEKSSAAVCKKSHEKSVAAAKQRYSKRACDHSDLGSLGYTHGTTVRCPNCGSMAQVW